jgi:excisionase family DNA binding protein
MNPQSTPPNPPSATSDLLTAPEAAIYLWISQGALRNWVCRRKIQFIRIGRAVRFRKAHLDRFISENLQPSGSLRS